MKIIRNSRGQHIGEKNTFDISKLGPIDSDVMRAPKLPRLGSRPAPKTRNLIDIFTPAYSTGYVQGGGGFEGLQSEINMIDQATSPRVKAPITGTLSKFRFLHGYFSHIPITLTSA